MTFAEITERGEEATLGKDGSRELMMPQMFEKSTEKLLSQYYPSFRVQTSRFSERQVLRSVTWQSIVGVLSRLYHACRLTIRR